MLEMSEKKVLLLIYFFFKVLLCALHETHGTFYGYSTAVLILLPLLKLPKQRTIQGLFLNDLFHSCAHLYNMP